MVTAAGDVFTEVMGHDSASERWVGVPEMAAHFGVGRDTIRRRAANGDLPGGILIGRLWRFKISEVEAALKAQAAARDPWARSPASRRALNRRRSRE